VLRLVLNMFGASNLEVAFGLVDGSIVIAFHGEVQLTLVTKFGEEVDTTTIAKENRISKVKGAKVNSCVL
jgi:hypothetical protein